MNLPPYNIYPVLVGDKIVLRQVQLSDLSDLIEISFYDAVKASTLDQAQEMNTKINQDYFDGNSIHWGIVDISTNRIVGTCGYYRGFENEKGELGCVLLPEYKGYGFMTSALNLAIDFGINHIGLKSVRAVTTKQNIKAVKLLQRLNFVQIAELKNDEIEFEFREKLA